MNNEEPITVGEAIRLWVRGIEDPRIWEERLIKNILTGLKEHIEVELEADEEERSKDLADADEDWEFVPEGVEEIGDEDLGDLIRVVLQFRKLKKKKKEIWKRVEDHFDKKHGFEWRRGYWHSWKKRHWDEGVIHYLFNAVYDWWMPPYPRGRRRAKEYPVEHLRELRAKGLSYREIEKETGIAKSTVHRILTRGEP